MQSALVSGGNGFLGYYLVTKLVKEKYDVTVVDDLSTSRDISYGDEVTFVRKRIEDFVSKVHFDLVAHLASRPSPEDYSMNPVATLMSNSTGTIRMLDIARESGALFFYTSSSEVYGNAQVIPTPESYNGYVSPNGIRSCYDEGKRFSEAIAMAYHRQYGLDVRIERPFNVYGPRIREDGLYGRVIPRFISQALKEENITVHGKGDQTRSFLYVDDWLEASWRFIVSPGGSGEVLNVGSQKEFTVLELAQKIKALTGSSSGIEHTEKRIDDPERRSADIGKAKKLLNWEPRTSLEDGLEKTINWFRLRSK